MKRITFSVLRNVFILIGVIASRELLQAQTLFGTTSSGGANNGGVIFTYDIANQQYKIQQQFAESPLKFPNGSLLQASDGNMYGMTKQGGANANGAIFSIDTSGKFTILASFSYATGWDPIGNLTEAHDGNLYGTTTQGGQDGSGTLFRFNISKDSITPLVSFGSVATGYSPGNVVLASDSNLYGTTSQGGANNGGTIFRYDLKKDTLITIFNFNSNDMPSPNLIQGIDGYLYGSTGHGGTSYGTLFRCSLNGSFGTVFTFNNTNGREPGGLMQAADSSFYGMTSLGGASSQGTIFKYNAKTGLTTLFSFSGSNGSSPNAQQSIVQGLDGNLYALVNGGGANNNGVIFECSTSGSFIGVVSFNGLSGGANPGGSLIQASDGNFYGLTNYGGPANEGVLFKYSTIGGMSDLVNFGSSTTGTYPFSGLAQGADGNLYGTTASGGLTNTGSLYRFTLTDTLSTIASFKSSNGNAPIGTPIQASNGNLYGMTGNGGAGGGGSIYEYTFINHFLNDSVVDFDITNGAGPYGNLIQASDGYMYGMTYDGGSSNNGVLFKFQPSGEIYTVLVNFPGGNSAYPQGSLIQGTDGALYGTTMGNPGSYGSIFKYVPPADSVITIATFNGTTQGASPQGPVIQGMDGNFYGMTSAGGSGGYGTLYKCTPSGTITTLVNFNGTNGEYPEGGLIQGPDSMLYGVTKGGGPGPNYGNLFKCSTSGVFTNLVTFNGSNGTSPYYVSLLLVKGVKISVTSPSCTDQTLTAAPQWSGKSPYTYSWSTGATTSSISGVTTSGTYSVTVSDANGIAYTGSVALPAYTHISATATGTNLICYGDSSGTAEVLASGGGLPYEYLWNNGKTTSSISSLAAGTHSVTVTDAYDCTTTASKNITQPSTILSANVSGSNITCNGLNNGSVSVIASGGNLPYTYSWNNGKTSSSISNLPPGTYCVVVTDSNKCAIMRCDTVHQPVSTLDSVRICMVSVDTGSQHNIIVWNKTGLTNIDSFKVYYLNSASNWQLISKLPFSASQFIDTSSINNPNKNTVRYDVIGVDSCGDDEPITSSAWQNTMYINNSPPGTFIWSGTGYLIQNVSLPVLTYYLYRDSLGNGNWQAIDSVSGTQNKMTDPDYTNYVNGRWYVGAKLNVSGCPNPVGRVEAGGYTISRSNILNKNPVGISELSNNYLISVYPNPAKELLNVKLSGLKESPVKISVTDMTGRILMERSDEKIANDFIIDISSLTNGIYFMKLETESIVKVVKFVKE
jgi:uncharacterized repeat protein (TIGR03803 family)